MHLEPFDVARLFVGAAVLGFASWTDWRWRRAPNVLWWVTALAGTLLLAAQLALRPDLTAQWPLLASSLAFAGLMLVFYKLGLLAGGADAKALMAIAVLIPLPVHLGAFPLQSSFLPPPFWVLGDALLAFLVIPLALFARNLARGHRKLPHAFVGVRMPVAEARQRHAWPMEYVKDGVVRTIWMPSRFLWEEEDWDALVAAGRTEVWVTPKVPFMLPLLVGFIAAFFAGDVLFGWVQP